MKEPPFLSAVGVWMPAELPILGQQRFQGRNPTLCAGGDGPGTKGGFWCKLTLLATSLIPLWVKGDQSWPCSPKLQVGNPVECVGAERRLPEGAGVRCSVWSLYLTLQEQTLSFAPCFPLTKSRGTTAPRAETASNTPLILNGWRLLGNACPSSFIQVEFQCLCAFLLVSKNKEDTQEEFNLVLLSV